MLVSYCCDIPEGKDVSSVKQGLLVRNPCARRLAELDDVKGFSMTEYCTIQNTELVLEVFRGCMEEFVTTYCNGEKMINIKRQGKRESCQGSIF